MSADFAILSFNETIGLSCQESTRVLEFEVEGVPAGAAYAQVRVFDLQATEPAIEVRINDTVLHFQTYDPAGSGRHQTLLLLIPDGTLMRGFNRFSLSRPFFSPETADSLDILEVIVHWRQGLLKFGKKGAPG